jgi:adenylate kinase
MLASHGIALDAVIELKVDEEALLRRIESRIADMQKRGEPLRPDDNPDVLHRRLAAYRQQTAPLIVYYRGHGILRSIDGMAPIAQVADAIEEVLDAAPAGPAPAPEPALKPAPKPVTKPAVKSALKSAAKPALKTGKPAAQQAAKAPPKSAAKPAAKSAGGSVSAKTATPAGHANVGKKSKAQASSARRKPTRTAAKPSASKVKSRSKAKSATKRRAARRPR